MKIPSRLRKACCDIKKRSAGWPGGVPQPKGIATALVDRKLAEWAPPMWEYPKPVFSVRLTTLGELVVEGRI